MFDPLTVKEDFPLLQQQIHGQKLVYLDNAATTQKPQSVIDAIVNYYQQSNANVHRGVHALSDRSTQLFEESRAIIAHFFNALPEELIFSPNSTAALNGVAYGWADHHLQSGDVILTSVQEHHSNLVVWQEVCKRTGAELKYLELLESGELDLEYLEKLLQNHHGQIKLVALTHVSNTLGVVNPLDKILQLIKANSTTESRPRVVIDAAQSAPRMLLDFKRLEVDFLAFSSHKMLGPMGGGGLLVKKSLLVSGEVQPWLFGGGMIQSVGKETTHFAAELNDRFTAGTPDVASVVGLAAACKYLLNLGMDNVLRHDQDLVAYTYEQLKHFSQVKVIGPEPDFTQLKRVGSVAFIYDGVHAHDVAQILDSEGVAVRSGHHCTMPLHLHFNWQATTRISFEVYNSRQDVDKCLEALHKVKQVFGK